MLNIQRYVHKPSYVQAVLVTDENMAEVSQWCNGTIDKMVEYGGRSFIKVDVFKPVSIRQTRAFAGDYVLKTTQGFKVFMPKPFEGKFDPAPETPAEELLTGIFKESPAA